MNDQKKYMVQWKISTSIWKEPRYFKSETEAKRFYEELIRSGVTIVEMYYKCRVGYSRMNLI